MIHRVRPRRIVTGVLRWESDKRAHRGSTILYLRGQRIHSIHNTLMTRRQE